MKKIVFLITIVASQFLNAQIYTAPSNSNDLGTLLPNSPNSTINVGIGTNNPQSKLQVENGDINCSAISTSTIPRRIGFLTNDRTLVAPATSSEVANYGLSFFATPFATGLSAPAPTNGPGVTLSGFWGLNFFTTGTEKMRIDRSGYVGIGTQTPTSLLHVNGDITAVTIKGPSDIRFKKNIKPLQNSLDKISALNIFC